MTATHGPSFPPPSGPPADKYLADKDSADKDPAGTDGGSPATPTLAAAPSPIPRAKRQPRASAGHLPRRVSAFNPRRACPPRHCRPGRLRAAQTVDQDCIGSEAQTARRLGLPAADAGAPPPPRGWGVRPTVPRTAEPVGRCRRGGGGVSPSCKQKAGCSRRQAPRRKGGPLAPEEVARVAERGKVRHAQPEQREERAVVLERAAVEQPRPRRLTQRDLQPPVSASCQPRVSPLPASFSAATAPHRPRAGSRGGGGAWGTLAGWETPVRRASTRLETVAQRAPPAGNAPPLCAHPRRARVLSPRRACTQYARAARVPPSERASTGKGLQGSRSGGQEGRGRRAVAAKTPRGRQEARGHTKPRYPGRRARPRGGLAGASWGHRGDARQVPP